MKSIIRYFNLLLGCAIVAFTVNFIIIPNKLVGFGFTGLASVIHYIWNTPVSLVLFLFNVFMLLISCFFISKETITRFLLPSILIPLFIFISSFFSEMLVIEFPETMLSVIISGVLLGYGYGLIFKQGFSGATSFLLEELMGKLTKFYSNYYSIVFDVVTLILMAVNFGYVEALYSLFIIIIARYMITKIRFGINEYKLFYVITSKEEKVKHFILHDLKYSLTELDVKGGFSKKESHVLMSIISTDNYYKMKSGIKAIDKDAFIVITDTYDALNVYDVNK